MKTRIVLTTLASVFVFSFASTTTAQPSQHVSPIDSLYHHWDDATNMAFLGTTDYVVIATGQSGISIVHSPSEDSLGQIGYLDTPSECFDVATLGSFIYGATAEGLWVVDGTDQTAPVSVTVLPMEGGAWRIVSEAATGKLYVAGEDSLHVFTTSDPTSPTLAGSLPLPAACNALDVDGRRLAVATETDLTLHDLTGAMPWDTLLHHPRDVLDVSLRGSWMTHIEHDTVSSYTWHSKLYSWDLTVPSVPQLADSGDAFKALACEIGNDSLVYYTDFGNGITESMILRARFRTADYQLGASIEMGFPGGWHPDKRGVALLSAGTRVLVTTYHNFSHLAPGGDRAPRVRSILLESVSVDTTSSNEVGYEIRWAGQVNGGGKILRVEDGGDRIWASSLQSGLLSAAAIAPGESLSGSAPWFYNGFDPPLYGGYLPNGNWVLGNPPAYLEISLSGDTLYVNDGERSLLTLEVSDPTNPDYLGQLLYDSSDDFEPFTAISSQGALVAGKSDAVGDELTLVDMNDPANPATQTTYSFSGLHSEALYFEDDYIYSAGTGIWVHHRSSGLEAPMVDSLFQVIGGRAHDIVKSGDLLVAASDSGFTLVDAADPENLSLISMNTTDAPARGVSIEGDIACFALQDHGLLLVNIADPTAPFVAGWYEAVGRFEDVALVDSVAYVAAGSHLIAYDCRPAYDATQAVSEPRPTPEQPEVISIAPPWPNPFNGAVTVAFDLRRAGTVELALYNITGRRVARLAPQLAAGQHRLQLDLAQLAPRLATGTYLLKVGTAGQGQTFKVQLLK